MTESDNPLTGTEFQVLGGPTAEQATQQTDVVVQTAGLSPLSIPVLNQILLPFARGEKLGRERQPTFRSVWVAALSGLPSQTQKELLEEVVKGACPDSTARSAQLGVARGHVLRALDVLDLRDLLSQDALAELTAAGSAETHIHQQTLGVMTAMLGVLRFPITMPYLSEQIFDPMESYRAALALRRIGESRIRRMMITDHGRGHMYPGVDSATIDVLAVYEDGILETEIERWGIDPNDVTRIPDFFHAVSFQLQQPLMRLRRQIALPMEDAPVVMEYALMHLKRTLQKITIPSSSSSHYRMFYLAREAFAQLNITDGIVAFFVQAYRESERGRRAADELGIAHTGFRAICNILDRMLIGGLSAADAITAERWLLSPMRRIDIDDAVARLVQYPEDYPHLQGMMPAAIVDFMHTAKVLRACGYAVDGDIIGQAAEVMGVDRTSINVRLKLFPYTISLLDRVFGCIVIPGEHEMEQVAVRRDVWEALLFLKIAEDVSAGYAEFRRSE